jgi:lysophospholipase L1-like esterase
MKIEPGSRLLFTGDSVTDCGRARPVGQGSRSALGNGYVAAVDAAFGASASAAIRVMNTGVGGNTVRDLAMRWDTDVLALGPDWLSVMIGINDVWRQFDGVDAAAAVLPDEYGRVLEGLVARTLPRLRGLVLMSPYYVQDMRSDPMRRRMDEYGAIARGIASRHGTLFVDTQAALDDSMAGKDYTDIAGDRVHPTHAGHGVIARAFLRAVGFSPTTRR